MDKIKEISKIFFDSAVTVAPEQGDYYAKLVVRNSSKIIKMLQGKGKIKEISKIFVDSAVTVAPEQGDYYAGIVVKNSSKIIEVLQGKNEIKEEIINTTFSLEEMAIADFKGTDLVAGSPKELAMNYVKNARSRSMSDKQIVSGLGVTFKEDGKLSKEIGHLKALQIKDEIKKELKLPDTNKPKLKASAIVKPTKKAKEDTVYKGTEKVRAAAKRASEVMKEDIFKNAGINEKSYSCDTDKKKKDKFYSKVTAADDDGKPTGRLAEVLKELRKDKKFLQANKKEQTKILRERLKTKFQKRLRESIEYSCKYCNERYDTEEAIDKHQKMCVA